MSENTVILSVTHHRQNPLESFKKVLLEEAGLLVDDGG
jgi:hypothetical protein